MRRTAVPLILSCITQSELQYLGSTKGNADSAMATASTVQKTFAKGAEEIQIRKVAGHLFGFLCRNE